MNAADFKPSYAGIGSRETPEDVLDFMAEVADCLAHKGYVLRSGGAPGADQAFLSGAVTVHVHRHPAVETYLPWDSFERQALTEITYSRSHVALTQPAAWTIPIAKMHHARWANLKHGAQLLHSRNVHQILGIKEWLQGGQIVYDRSKFVICWTKDGATTASETSRETGGTGQAIRIADAFGVPVFNLNRPDHRERIEGMLLDYYSDKED